MVSSFPRILSLQGVWHSSFDSFIYEAVKIFRKRSSNSPHDYWISYVCGACLSTVNRSTSARYDPSTNYLSFSPSSKNLANSPWKLFVSPLDQSLSTNPTQQMIFITQYGLKELQQKRPHLLPAAWENPIANKELMDFILGVNCYPLWGTLPLIKEREVELFQDEPLSHDAIWNTSRLASIDSAERRRDNNLKKETSGRLIAP